MVAEEGVKPDPDKVAVVKDWPELTTVTELRVSDPVNLLEIKKGNWVRRLLILCFPISLSLSIHPTSLFGMAGMAIGHSAPLTQDPSLTKSDHRMTMSHGPIM